MGRRRKTREVALQFLYQLDLHSEDDPARHEAESGRATRLTRRLACFGDALVRGTKANQGKIDQIIAQSAEHWDLERMAVVDRNNPSPGLSTSFCGPRTCRRRSPSTKPSSRQEVRDEGVEPLHQRLARSHPQRTPSDLLSLRCGTRCSRTFTVNLERSKPCWRTRDTNRRAPLPRDLVGYGADPVACVEMVAGRAQTITYGNHEQAVAGGLDLDWFNPHARAAADGRASDWTTITGEIPDRAPAIAEVAMPRSSTASPDRPDEWDYLISAETVQRVLGVRHTPVLHRPFPSARRLVAGLQRTEHLPGSIDLSLERGRRYIVNVGQRRAAPRPGSARGLHDLGRGPRDRLDPACRLRREDSGPRDLREGCPAFSPTGSGGFLSCVSRFLGGAPRGRRSRCRAGFPARRLGGARLGGAGAPVRDGREPSGARRLRVGWLYGTVYFLVLLRWLDFTFRTYSDIPWPLTWALRSRWRGIAGFMSAAVAGAVSWLADLRSAGSRRVTVSCGWAPSGSAVTSSAAFPGPSRLLAVPESACHPDRRAGRRLRSLAVIVPPNAALAAVWSSRGARRSTALRWRVCCSSGRSPSGRGA